MKEKQKQDATTGTATNDEELLREFLRNKLDILSWKKLKLVYRCIVQIAKNE